MHAGLAKARNRPSLPHWRLHGIAAVTPAFVNSAGRCRETSKKRNREKRTHGCTVFSIRCRCILFSATKYRTKFLVIQNKYTEWGRTLSMHRTALVITYTLLTHLASEHRAGSTSAPATLSRLAD